MSERGSRETAEPRPTKGRLSIDPKGLIYEAYRIDGITEAECRTIFLDWALNVPPGRDLSECAKELYEEYGIRNVRHPMTRIISDGTREAEPPRRKGGRNVRRAGRTTGE